MFHVPCRLIVQAVNEGNVKDISFRVCVLNALSVKSLAQGNVVSTGKITVTFPTSGASTTSSITTRGGRCVGQQGRLFVSTWAFTSEDQQICQDDSFGGRIEEAKVAQADSARVLVPARRGTTTGFKKPVSQLHPKPALARWFHPEQIDKSRSRLDRHTSLYSRRRPGISRKCHLWGFGTRVTVFLGNATQVLLRFAMRHRMLAR